VTLFPNDAVFAVLLELDPLFVVLPVPVFDDPFPEVPDPPFDVESVEPVVTFVGELSSSTLILSSFPELSVVTAYIPKFCIAYCNNIFYFLCI